LCTRDPEVEQELPVSDHLAHGASLVQLLLTYSQ